MNEKIKIITKNTKKIKNYIFAILLALPLFTVFSNSNSLVYPAHTAKMFYFYLVSVIIFTIFALYSIFKKEPIKINITKIDIALLSYYFYSFIRIFFTSNTKIYNDNFIIFTFLIILYFLWKNIFGKNSQDENNIPQNIILFSLLIVGSSWAIFGLLQLYKIVPGNYGGIFTVTGNYGNPSPYANFLAPFVPFGLGVYLLVDKNKVILRNAGLVTFIVSVLVLPVTISRSAWLGAFGGSLLILDYKYKLLNRLFKIFDKLWKKILISILIIAIMISGMIFLYRLKEDSGRGRILQWKIMSKMITDKPIFGHGYESFAFNYDNYQAEYFKSKDRPEVEKMLALHNTIGHNDYLEITTELGIIGIFLFLSIIVLSVIKYLSIYKQNNNSNFIPVIAFSGIFVFLIQILFDPALQRLPMFILFVFFISAVSIYTKKIFSVRLNKIPIILISLVTILILILFTKDQIENYNAQKQWKLAKTFTNMRNYSYAETKYKKAYSKLKTNGTFLLNYGGALSFNKKFSEAIPILEESTKYLTDPNLFTLLGICYTETNNIEKAEYYLNKAQNIIPHQMYPRFLLVKLYRKSEEHKKAIKVANEIMNMKVKIDNTASREIKAEIQKYLRGVVETTSE